MEKRKRPTGDDNPRKQKSAKSAREEAVDLLARLPKDMKNLTIEQVLSDAKLSKNPAMLLAACYLKREFYIKCKNEHWVAAWIERHLLELYNLKRDNPNPWKILNSVSRDAAITFRYRGKAGYGLIPLFPTHQAAVAALAVLSFDSNFLDKKAQHQFWNPLRSGLRLGTPLLHFATNNPFAASPGVITKNRLSVNFSKHNLYNAPDNYNSIEITAERLTTKPRVDRLLSLAMDPTTYGEDCQKVNVHYMKLDVDDDGSRSMFIRLDTIGRDMEKLVAPFNFVHSLLTKTPYSLVVDARASGARKPFYVKSCVSCSQPTSQMCPDCKTPYCDDLCAENGHVAGTCGY